MGPKHRLVFALVFVVAAALPALATAAQSDRPRRDYWPTERWRTSSPAAQGMDGATLDEAERIIEESLPDVTGLVVVRGGEIVFERYFNGYQRDDPVNVRSVTKSVVSALVGIALDEGEL